MDWVLNNLDNVIIPIIIMILYGLGTFSQKKGKSGKKAPPNRQPQADPAEARRVAEIQEEIRKKIAERTGRVSPPPPPLKSVPARPVPVNQPSSRNPMPYSASRQKDKISTPDRPHPVPSPASHSFSMESYQKDIEAKMKKVRELEAKVKTVPGQGHWEAKSKASVPNSQLRKQLFRDLAHPLGQKKAILVGEILGSPVGIKGPAGWKSNV